MMTKENKYLLTLYLLGMVAAVLIIFAIIFTFTGCAHLGSVKSTVEDHKGEIWTVVSKKDGVVELKRPDGTIIKVDNRGAPGFFEQYMQYLLIQAAPRVELSNQPGTDH